ncbi:MAG: hypothetical protein AAF581_10560 [Planctomycetota bacterium]
MDSPLEHPLAGLSTEELKQAYEGKPQTARVRAIFEEEMRASGTSRETELVNLREDAYLKYWHQVIGDGEITEAIFTEWLQSDFRSALQLLGDAAWRCQLTSRQCRLITDQVPSDEWTWRQADSYLAVCEIEGGGGETGTSWERAAALVDRILKNRTPLLMYDVVHSLDIADLPQLVRRIEDSPDVSKYYRHNLKQEIRKREREGRR